MRNVAAFVTTALLSLALCRDASAASANSTSQHATSFRALDQDGDGSLNASEAGADLWSSISVADANSDGIVTPTELQSTHRATQHGKH